MKRVLVACCLALAVANPALAQEVSWNPIQEYLVGETGYAPAYPQPEAPQVPDEPEEYAAYDEWDAQAANAHLNAGVRGMNF